MKAGILTIIDNDNYGNRLQNYAVQNVLLKEFDNIETIKNDAFSNTREKYLLRKIRNISKNNTYSNNPNRKKNFQEFNRYINFSKKKVTAFSKNVKYDICFVGSDQVWNPFIKRLREVDLLSFIATSKRISFSASFGINELPKEYHKKLKKEISKFKAISVREEAGKEIIKDVVGRKDVEVLVDPTMLLTAEEWDKVSTKPKMLKSNKFILNYFLGDLSEKRKKEIDKVAKENNCEVINILDKNSPFYECGPSEFLYLEKNAFLICTDSFHSSVFAILYKRPFLVFDREDNTISMNSRLETLLSKFKLEDQKYKNKITKKDLKCDYIESYKILEKERKKSIEWLKNALSCDEQQKI